MEPKIEDSTVQAGREVSSSYPDQEPSTVFNLYRRCWGTKQFFSDPSSDIATYFIKNPVPHKHSDTWKPVMHRGDNPKYVETSLPVARARRTAMWSSFRIELGDGVHEVLENKRRAQQRKWYGRKQKMRKFFCMRSKPPKKPLEDEQPVKGFVMAVTMRRKQFLNRTLTFEWAGQEYRWTGTRMFLPNWSKGMKGVSHAYKVGGSVRPEDKLLTGYSWSMPEADWLPLSTRTDG